MFSAIRSRIFSQNCWLIPHSFRILQRQTEKLNHRTLTFSARYFQQPPPTKETSPNLSPVLDNNENKSPFIFSKTSSEIKYTKDQTDQEKREREAKAAWDIKMLKFTGYFLGIWLCSTVGYIILVWGSPQIDQEGNLIEDKYSNLPKWQQYLKRSFHGILDYMQTIKDPTSDKLLPDPLPAPYQPTYTLVIEMSGILLNPEWAYNTGWRYKKRPGLDYFLKEVGYPVYEVVIYTKESPWVSQLYNEFQGEMIVERATDKAAPSIVANMDSEHRIMYTLFRENTRFINGTHVKDLSCLNRDLKKVIILDWDEQSYQLQPRNALHRLKKWDGHDEDRQLLHLAAFLRMIAASGVEDVRDVLDHYNQESDPVEAFLFRQQQLIEAEEQKRQAAAAANAPVKQSKGLFGSWKRF